MDIKIKFSDDEISKLNKVLSIQSERAKHSITITYLIDRWNRFVSNVENGYRLTIDDYTNSLSGRNLLQDALDVCPDNLEFREHVGRWDDRLIKVTRLIKKPLLPPLSGEKLGWWWFRFPLNPGRELKYWVDLV